MTGHLRLPKTLVCCCAACAVFVCGRRAAALTCAAPPSITVAYPGPGAVVPVNAVILLSLRNPALPVAAVRLVRLGRKRPVPTRVVRDKSSAVVRLAPAGPLDPKTVYEVYLGNRRLTTFRTIPGAEPSVAPEVKSARVRFTKPSTVVWFRGRRSASLTVRSPKGRVPAALEVRFAYVYFAPQKRTLKTYVALPYAADLRVASANYCSSLPGAPKNGTYRLTVIPWSATGKPGRPFRLAGRVK